MSVLLFCLWFFLPAGLANAAPVFAVKLPYFNLLAFPLDLNKSFRGKRIFGDNKTWLGLFAGILTATIVVAVQKYLFIHFGWAKTLSGPVDYSLAIVWWLGPLLGAGALLGDAIESFFKRRVGKKSGESWFPFDQIDYIIGGLLASALVVQLSWTNYVVTLAVWFLLHLVSTYIGHLIGLREQPI